MFTLWGRQSRFTGRILRKGGTENMITWKMGGRKGQLRLSQKNLRRLDKIARMKHNKRTNGKHER